MRRLLCWLGVHDWLVTYKQSGFEEHEPVFRRCLRCKVEEDFAWERA